MEWIRISEVCRPKQWKTISMKNLKEEGYPVYGANGIIGYYDEYTHEEDTLMITCRGATCGSINMSNEKAYINGNAMALDDLNNEIIDIKYFYYYLLGYDFADIISGSAQPQITRTNLNRLKIPVPPINIQKQIVEVLDKAQSLIDNRKEQIKLLDDLIESVFYDMFGDPVRNDKGWEITELGKLGSMKNGLNYSKKDKGYLMKVVSVADFQNYVEINDTSILNKIELNAKPSEEYLLKNGDILFVRSNGNRKLVGRNVGIYPKDDIVTFSGFSIRFRITKEQIISKFLNRLLSTKPSKTQLFKNIRGANIQNLNQEMLYELTVILPPLQLQNQFAKKVKQIESQKQLLEESLKLLEYNYNSLMQKAFKGELFN